MQLQNDSTNLKSKVAAIAVYDRWRLVLLLQLVAEVTLQQFEDVAKSCS